MKAKVTIRRKSAKARPAKTGGAKPALKARAVRWEARRDVATPEHRALLLAQTELEASRARYAELYDTAPVGYVTLTRSGIIEEINLTGAELLGYPRRQLLRHPLLVFLARHDRRRYMKYLSELRRLPGRRSVEVELMRREKEPPVFIEVVTVGTGDGTLPAFFQSALIDITARRGAEVALRESESRFRTLARHAPVGIFLSNAGGGTHYVNEAWCAMTGMPFEEALGFGWMNALHPEDRERIEAGWRESVDNGASSAAEFRFVRPDGGLVWVQGQAIQLKNAAGKFAGCIGTIVDITAHKQMEEESKRTHTELQAALRAKDDFLAMLSHELRTPLNPVLLLASEAAANRDLAPGARADFDVIRKNVEVEARIIDDLLDITRVTHGKFALEKRTVHIHAVLNDAIATVQNDVEQKNIHLKLALDAKRDTVSGDPMRLQQVFWNVLRNAIKFTPENGTVTVQSQSEGSALVVKITDTGIGISNDNLERIFDAFSQGARPGCGGLGLGLTISKKLLDLHSGSIHALSAGENRGATFHISLPLVKAERTPAPPAPEPPLPPVKTDQPPPARTRVLLVEDHEPTRAALTRLLLNRRFVVTGAASVAEAHSLIDQTDNVFDLLISDIGLPDGTGYDLMQELRERPHLEGIALTGYGMEEDVQRSYAAGFTAHLTKPIKIELLDQVLATVMKRA